MPTFVAANWQKSLPVLAAVRLAMWIALFRNDPTTEQAIFAALLVIYMLHQTEEHLWPGGFRQFTNAHVFKSGSDDWPVDTGGVALVNIGYVWLPVGGRRAVSAHAALGRPRLDRADAGQRRHPHRHLDPIPPIQSGARDVDRAVPALHGLGTDA